MSKTDPQTEKAPVAKAPAPLAPRPLALHLALQNLTFASSLLALKPLREGSLAWNPALQAPAGKLAAALANVNPADFEAAVQAEIAVRVRAFAGGVDKFRRAPRPPAPPAPPVIWSEGTTRLLDYRLGTGKSVGKAAGVPVLVVPSLINRAHILDLTPSRSLMRHLAAAGARPFLVDWDAPGSVEAAFSIDDYVDRLERARDCVIAECGSAPAVVGYCMGGLLALALVHRQPDRVGGLALLATPWDFHAQGAASAAAVRAAWPCFEGVIELYGHLPVDVLQAMFASLDPGATAAKYRRFGGLDLAGRAAREFIALEDWLNDGVPLPGPAARECLWDWYILNATAEGRWRSGGRIVDPATLMLPALVVVPELDYIVPPESARPLGKILPAAEIITLPAGHIGMVSGSKAETLLHDPLAAWISELPECRMC